MEYVIVGCGSAGRAAARAIREADREGPVTMVSFEFTPYYVKPCLADFLAGDLALKDLVAPDPFILDDTSIRVLAGKRAVGVDTKGRRLRLSDGEVLPYDRLLLAPGSEPSLPEGLAAHREKLHLLRALNDAVRIRSLLEKGTRAAVLGEGIPALEAVRALSRAGAEVTWIAPGPPFRDAESGGIGEAAVMKRLESAGVRLCVSAPRDILDLDGRSYRIFPEEGEPFDCGILLAVPGMRPAVDFVKGSVLCRDGIVVDEALRTRVSNVFAAGDAAQFYDVKRERSRMNFGWVSAGNQGRVAGANMAGEESRVYVDDEDDYFRALYGRKLLDRW